MPRMANSSGTEPSLQAGSDCAPGTASLATLKPWVDHVLATFGPDRVVWGSDWPVVNLGTGLPDWISLSRALLQDLSGTEQDQIAHGNAKRLYRV